MWVGGWVVGGGVVRRYFQHNRGGLELIFFVLEGVLSKFLLDNSTFSAPLQIIIAQSLSAVT